MKRKSKIKCLTWQKSFSALVGVEYLRCPVAGDRLYPHFPHPDADMACDSLVAPVPEFVPDASGAHKRVLQMNLAHETHEIPVSIAYRHRAVVNTRPGEIQQSALPCEWQRMLPADHFFALDPSMRPSATDKKSFSIASSPIFAWSSFVSGSWCFLSLSKTPVNFIFLLAFVGGGIY